MSKSYVITKEQIDVILRDVLIKDRHLSDLSSSGVELGDLFDDGNTVDTIVDILGIPEDNTIDENVSPKEIFCRDFVYYALYWGEKKSIECVLQDFHKEIEGCLDQLEEEKNE